MKFCPGAELSDGDKRLPHAAGSLLGGSAPLEVVDACLQKYRRRRVGRTGIGKPFSQHRRRIAAVSPPDDIKLGQKIGEGELLGEAR